MRANRWVCTCLEICVWCGWIVGMVHYFSVIQVAVLNPGNPISTASQSECLFSYDMTTSSHSVCVHTLCVPVRTILMPHSVAFTEVSYRRHRIWHCHTIVTLGPPLLVCQASHSCRCSFKGLTRVWGQVSKLRERRTSNVSPHIRLRLEHFDCVTIMWKKFYKALKGHQCAFAWI